MRTEDREGVLKRGNEIVSILNQLSVPKSSEALGEELDESLVNAAIENFKSAFNETTGAFGSGPNFPRAVHVAFLIRSSAPKTLDSGKRNAAREMALASLDAIIRRGINDHIGGGFHRYTVDREWQLPHFEKILYDQGNLIDALLEAWRATSEQRCRKAVFDTCSYLMRASGGFCSAEDAESYESETREKKSEGTFFIWSLAQAQEALGDGNLLAMASAYYGIRANGNAPRVSSSSEALDGYNILRVEK